MSKFIGFIAAILAAQLFGCGDNGGGGSVSSVQPTVVATPVDIRFVNVPTEGKSIIPGAKDVEMAAARVDCQETLCPAVTELTWQGKPTNDLSAFTNLRLVRSDGSNVNTEASYTVAVDNVLKQMKVNFFSKWTPATGRVPPETYSFIGDVATSAKDGAALTLDLKTVQPHEAETKVESNVQGDELKVKSIPGVSLPEVVSSSSAFPQIDPNLFGSFVSVGSVTVKCPAEDTNFCALKVVKILTQDMFNVQISLSGIPVGFTTSFDGSVTTYDVELFLGPGSSSTLDLSAFVFGPVPAVIFRDMTFEVTGSSGEQIRVNPNILGAKGTSCGRIVSKQDDCNG